MTVTATRRVLLVEDNDPTRLALRLLLEGRGHTVEEADDGLDGVRKALASKPEVILVDIDMPVFDGYGVAWRVREALGGGFDAHLLKPADPERVCSLVQGAASSRR
jgi:CheY-like chemotaxis protein